MSIRLYAGCFTNGESTGFPRALLDARFESWVVRRQLGCLTMRFGEQGESYLYRAEDDEIDGFKIHRPANAAAFCDALFAVLGSANLVLYNPDETPPLVASARVATHLPRGMIDALGEPVVLNAPGDIQRWVWPK